MGAHWSAGGAGARDAHLCTSCWRASVDKYKRRPIYLIAINSFDGEYLDTCEEAVA